MPPRGLLGHNGPETVAVGASPNTRRAVQCTQNKASIIDVVF